MAAQHTVSGLILDSASREPLPFVAVIANDDNHFGTMSDIDGRFSITSILPITSLEFRYVGYRTLRLVVPERGGSFTVLLASEHISIPEVVVHPGVNPAHRIIKQVIDHRKTHDPEQLPSFRYISYNKLYAGVDAKAMHPGNTLSISAGTGTTARDSATSPTPSTDSTAADSGLIRFLETHHLFLMETVSERVFKQPGKSYERIIANRVSGLEDPTFFILATQLQSLDFYDEHFTLLDKNYLSPVSPGSTRNYVFIIEDTLFSPSPLESTPHSGTDTTFIVSFRPRRGKVFDGLRGLLYVNSNGYAIQSVMAEPADTGGTRIRIQQNYERVSGHWFPTQLNTDFELTNVVVNGVAMFLVGRTYLKEIEIEPELRGRDFGSVTVEMEPDASQRDSVIARYRQDSLTVSERNTYEFIDSLGEAENLDRRLSGMRALLDGKIALGPLNWDLTELIGYNTALGWKLALALETNERVSRRFSAQGALKYAIGAQVFEYGGLAKLNLWPAHELFVQGGYRHEYIEPGQVTFLNDRITWLDKLLIQALLPSEISVQEWHAGLGFRAVKYLSANLQLSHGQVRSRGDYLFLQEFGDVIVGRNFFLHTTASAQFKYAFKEKVIRTPDETFSLDTKYPVLWFNLERSLPDVWRSGFDYWRLSAKVAKTFLVRKLGTTSLALTGGLLVGDAPYYNNFLVLGSQRKWSVLWLEGAFNTMGTSEFLSDRFVSARLTHNFAQLVFGKGRFTPMLRVTTAVAFGTLTRPEVHHGFTYKTMDRGFYESGVIFDRIVKARYLNVLTVGLGVGAFYRYGPYTLYPWWKNGAVRLTLAAGL